MKVVFCTNIWNHHQGPVAKELAYLLGDDFKMLLHQPLDHPYSIDRIKNGWNINPPCEKWIVGPPATCENANYSKYVVVSMDADVLICDSLPPYLNYGLLRQRRKSGKINIITSERLLKKALRLRDKLSPRWQLSRIKRYFQYESSGIHFLTMSHWCADDLAYFHACRNRTWRWGYLTAVSGNFVPKKRKEHVYIGWCGRMLTCKRVADIIEAFRRLPRDLRNIARVRLVGSGECEQDLKDIVAAYGLSEYVSFHPFMSHMDAMVFLQEIDIFVFPSDRNEGWGATLLEAMDRGCAVIASKAAGATLDVVEDGKNGFAVECSNVDMISSRIANLLRDEKLRLQMGYLAWKSIQNWSPQEGARRLVLLMRNLANHSVGTMQVFHGLCERVR